VSVREVLRMGDSRLLDKAGPVTEFASAELGRLIQDMHDTMEGHQGAGLAAPQIGVPLQVVIFGGGKNPRYPDEDAVPYTVLLNPRVEVLDTRLITAWEGCLSLPGLRGEVGRYAAIRYLGQSPGGDAIKREVSGFHARVVQHEVDHLAGVLFPQRMTDMRRFGFEEVLNL